MTVSTSGRIKVLMLMLLFHNSGAFAQKSKTDKEASDKPRSAFRVSVGVVVVNATVTDKHGATVTDLTQRDFRVYEDGKLQSIQTFALESYKPVPTGKAMPQRSGTNAATSAEPNFSRPRLISLMIDDIASNPEDRFLAVTKAVKRFIETDMGPGDQVSIVSGSGRVQYPFSNDKQLLHDEVATLQQKLNWNPALMQDCPELTDLQAKMIQDYMDDGVSMATAVAEVSYCMQLSGNAARAYARTAALRRHLNASYLNRTLLITLRRYLGSLRHFDAAKCAILFSDGFLYEDVSNELQDVVEQALRSGVVLNTVNVRGLWTYPTVSAAPGRSAGLLQSKQLLYGWDLSAQENPLNQMARETGGVYFSNNNDLYSGIREISSRQDYYYVLTYAIPSHKPDGSYHSIKLEVIRPDLKVSYRKGYYSPKEEVTFERRKKEDLLEALQAPGNLNEIPMGLSYNYYQADDAAYVVSLLMKVDIRRLRFLDEDSRRKNLISMVVVAFDENDRYVDGLDKSVDFRLTPSNYASLLERGMTSKVEFKLPLGRYKIKAIVREALEGKMGSLTRGIEIP